MKAFTRDDGRTLEVVEGYRDRVLAERSTYSPRDGWDHPQYEAAAEKKLKRSRKFLREFSNWGGNVEGAQVLDMACGDGINCLIMALQPVRNVVGIDLELPLVESVERTDRTHRLASAVFVKACVQGKPAAIVEQLPVRFVKMNATAMGFPNESFDLVMSRSAIEHIRPVERAFAEVARVVRPGGLIHLSTDPYFSPRGCHKTGIVDIPWAHARLSIDEYRRFVTETEGSDRSVVRCQRLESLNQYTIRQWQEKLEAGPFEILEWRQECSPMAEALLAEYPEVRETLLEGVERRDLIHNRLNVWLRRKEGSQ